MGRASITKRTADAARPMGQVYVLWDDSLAGFGLKITPAGGKVYLYQYREPRPGAARSAPTKRITIGKHGDVTPDQARQRARELAAQVAQGQSPRQLALDAVAKADQAQRDKAEQARLADELAFAKMVALWLDYYEHERGRGQKSMDMARLVVNRYLVPRLGNKPMPHITRADLQPIIDAIPRAKQAMRRNVYTYAHILFGWAWRRGDIAANPLAAMVKPPAPKARDRVLDDAELAAVWQASLSLANPFGAFFRLLILTGQRRDEVARLNWQELDKARATWTIPASRAKNGTAHIVPLSPAVMAELDRLAGGAPAWPNSGPVLTTNQRSPIGGITKAKLALEAAIATAREGETMPHWVIHDLRRTLATGLQRLGIRFEVTEATLNHVSGAKGGVAGVYQRHDWKEEKRTALDAWARHVASLHSPAPAENVIAMRISA